MDEQIMMTENPLEQADISEMGGLPQETYVEDGAKAASEETADAQTEASSSQETETYETTGEEIPDDPTVPLPAWIGLGVVAGLVVGVLVSWLVRKLCGRKKKPAAISKTQELNSAKSALPPLQISKLHDQGARSSQQDSFALSPAELIPTHGLLAVVCDGMGGLKDGDKVSQTAVSAMVNGFLEFTGAPDQVLLALLERANRAVNHLLGPAGQRRSGTTMVAGILRDERFYYLSVGDSRICLYRNGQLFQLNREHTYVNELSARAVNDMLTLQEAWSDPQGSGLTSFLGMGDLKYVDIPAGPQQVRRGDKLILMSDGVYNALTEQELTAALDCASGADAEALGAAISAKHYENQDNYTAVILTVNE